MAAELGYLLSEDLVELVRTNAVGDINLSEVLRIFNETGITESILEDCYIPFRNGRLMPLVLMLDILLWKQRDEIEECLERGTNGLSKEILMTLYMRAVSGNSWLFRPKEKLFFGADFIYSYFSFGVLSPLFKCSFIEIFMGYYASRDYCTDIKRVGIKVKKGKICYPDFLYIESDEEAQRIIRMTVIKKKKSELTGINPYYEDEDIQAIRPPAAAWGLHKKISEE